MQKPTWGPDGDILGGAPEGDALSAAWPALWRYLTDDRWDDGSPRERATVLLVVEGPFVKAWLNDRAAQRSAWVTGVGLEDTLKTLDQGLAQDSLAWRRAVTYNRKKN